MNRLTVLAAWVLLFTLPPARAGELPRAEPEAIGLRDEKIAELKPRLVCLVYKQAIEELCEKRWPSRWGLLDERLGNSRLFLLPL